MPGTKGLSCLAHPHVGSRKEVSLCNLLRHLSHTLHPMLQLTRMCSVLQCCFPSLLPGFCLIGVYNCRSLSKKPL